MVARNTVSPQTHEFIMQGIESLYLAYRPLFYHINGRRQLILAALFSNEAQAIHYKTARRRCPSTPFQLRTHHQTTIEEILNGKMIVGDVMAGK